MGAFGGAKAQNFLKVLAPVGARKEAFEQTGGARKNRTFFHGFWLVGAAAGEKKKSGRAEIHLGFLPFTGQSARGAPKSKYYDYPHP